MTLKEAFGTIFIISLKSRPERLARLLANLWDTGLAERGDCEIIEALPGDEIWPPAWFKAGGGAWGCLLSHARVLQTGIQRGLDRWLVLEDDCLFHAEARPHLGQVMAALPPDWGQLYLGGQHLDDPEELGPFIWRAKNVNRTHAFAVAGRCAAKIHQHLWHAPDYADKVKGWHIDHQLGLAHARNDWPVYCPSWWLAGQADGESDISGRRNVIHWWQPKRWAHQLPFVVGHPSVEHRHLVHMGWNLDKAGVDTGLNDAIGRPEALQHWLWRIAEEALDLGLIPCAHHPLLIQHHVDKFWPRTLPATHLAPVLVDYPANGLIAHPFWPPANPPA